MDKEAVLPEPVRVLLESLRSRSGGGFSSERTAAAVAGVAALPPDIVPAAAHEIACAVRPRSVRYGFFRSWSARPIADQEWLQRVPSLEWIFLFHEDGYVREAALAKIDAGAPSAFFVVAVAYRLNDWVREVRAAARRCADRSFPKTEPKHLAEAALFLLDRGRSWRRWGHEADALPKALVSRDVAAVLAETMAGRAQGPMPQVLARLLRWPEMDAHLPALFRAALQPGVRALTLDALIRGTARLPAGRENKWVDRSMGRYAQVTRFEERPLAVHLPVDALVLEGARDPGAAVRRVAGQALIDRRTDDPGARVILERLAGDPSPAVRSRAKFALGRLEEQAAQARGEA